MQSFYQSPLHRSMDVDPSAAVLWLLAVSTAVAAALWAGSDSAFEAKCIRSTFDDEVHLPSLYPHAVHAPTCMTPHFCCFADAQKASQHCHNIKSDKALGCAGKAHRGRSQETMQRAGL